ncbi:class I SAM-dependent methyltransferase [Candidatus Magnetominusculus xianensis]|uniref:SAM-dependent methyltransferase n=1 Tax=Candidatus Magnetominusculus xianensis TaxID=1748249 RepID=A0ABR5SJH6_9BACT|nr:class I SAM-dependent methyltransferase [Candidatus Magnetominusculus xianensis]KWT91547.1 SAM-dependent methyltransferase [Candidatus Magnetominusculus xianensis]MBF0404333.1 class I SAM-dependent methyltransferase [Nitrospirota bacterium]
MTGKADILKYIYHKSPQQQKKIEKNFAEIKGMESALEEFIQTYEYFLKANSLTHEDLANAYLWMVNQMLYSRKVFVQTGKYPLHCGEDEIKGVYDNKDIMMKYLLGLALSQFLWRQHYLLIEFYRNEVKMLESHTRLLEIGSGHGLFSLEILKNPGIVKSFDIIDISDTSLEISKSIIKTLKPEALNIINFYKQDVNLFAPSTSYDFIIMGEVLEHIEDPLTILMNLYKLLVSGGKLFITTCVNCPTIDHRYHFESIESIQEMITTAGFEVLREIVVPSENISREKLIKYKVDLSYAATLKRR